LGKKKQAEENGISNRPIYPIFISPLTGVAAADVMGIIPPWIDIFSYEGIGSEGLAGYAVILDLPKPQLLHTARIDVSRLLVQWLVVRLAAGGGVF
jgi:hypothetical protein